MKKALVLCAVFLCSSWAVASDYTLLTSEPARKAKAEVSAEELFIELVKELFKRVDMTVSIQQEPWIKAQRAVKKSPPSQRLLIAPLTRSEEREDDYDWLVPLASYKLQFIAVDKALDLSNIESLKDEPVCVLRESPAEYKLKELGFPDILSRVQVQKCYKGLKQGRQKVVLAHGDRVARALYEQVGGNPNELLFGQPFTEYSVYLAAAKAAVTSTTKQQLLTAMDAMKIDGSYAAIMSKYK